ncbi:MAG: prepilin-type N-terminal cleavage/methylation domain-containing protein [Planctomycetota bacterium]|nr:prepilin-type N-terminal cleavage/methylation domain-containing protein [Planctomycetota bacterium]
MPNRPCHAGWRAAIHVAAGGFTLVELVAVMAIVGILAAVAIPTLQGLTARRGAIAAARLVRDLDYARGVAVHDGATTWVVFSPAGASYQISAEPVGTTGRVDRVPVRDPASNGSLTRMLNTADVAGVLVTAADFDGSWEVGFNWMGVPLNQLELDLTVAGVVTLTGGSRVTVEPETGFVTAN